METTLAKQTKTTPEIVFNNIDNKLTVKGNSFPVESELFWSMIINQIKNFDQVDVIEIDLEYINTNSIVYILNIIKLNTSIINWTYEKYDEDMYELGKMFKKLSKNQFNFISKLEFDN